MLNLARTGVGVLAGSVVPLVWASESAGSLEAGLESLTIRGGADVLAGGGGHGDPGLIFDAAAAGNSTMVMFNFNIDDADVLASSHVCSADVHLPGT